MSIFGEQMAPAERDIKINRICQRWIKYKIRESVEAAKAGRAGRAECGDCGSTGHDTGSNTCPGPDTQDRLEDPNGPAHA